MTKAIDRTILSSLLMAYWLRPESALWYSAMLSLARKFEVDNLESRESLDFGCMDGINSYVLLGGNIPVGFDAFGGMEESYSMQKKLSVQDDYYDQVNIRDLRFDGLPPGKSFTHGVDWKKSHIERARLLKAHDCLHLWDKSSLMPIGASSIDLIWAPNIYWMEDLANVFKEFRRITRAGDSLIVIVPDVKLLQHLIVNAGGRFENEWLSMLDRGRYQNAARSARSKDEWAAFFKTENFSVERAEGFISVGLIKAYEIGFRPMFSPLLHMKRLLAKAGPDELLEVKSAWINTLLGILDPLIECDYFAPAPAESLWHMFLLARK